nr:SGNH hydrolase domain-containing protein [Pseudomonas fluorescens]
MQQKLTSSSSLTTDCAIPLKNYKEYNSGVLELMSAVEKKYSVIRLSDALCDETLCRTIVDGVPMYRDSGHLSYVGSAKIFDILSNAKKLW